MIIPWKDEFLAEVIEQYVYVTWKSSKNKSYDHDFFSKHHTTTNALNQYLIGAHCVNMESENYNEFPNFMIVWLPF